MGLLRKDRPKYRIGNPERVSASRNALTAAGDKIKKEDASAARRLIQPWQSLALGYYDELGEIKFAAQFYARMLSPLKLYAAEKDENGDLVPTENANAKDALDRIQDPGGGRTSLLGSYGRLMFLTGEAYLLCTIDPETGLEQWEMLSTDELRVMERTYMRYRSPSLQVENYKPAPDDAWEPLDEKSAVAYRLWKRHPRFSALADSTMQGVLLLCDELSILTRVVRARARSRMAGSGILLIDERVTVLPSEPAPDENAQEDPFLADLTEAMTTAIIDEGSASAVVPLIARVEPPDGMSVKDMIAHIQIIDPMQVYPETGLRRECIDRIAIGLDMPAEILTGLQDSNHWTAWAIDEQTWKGHGQPLAQQLCDDLTASYFRLELRDRGVPNWENFCVAYDASAIINHPDRTKDAKDLWDRNVISDEALRDTAGFNEDDAPSEEERLWALGKAIRDAGLALYGIPTLRPGAELEPAGDTIVSTTGDVTGPPPASAENQPPEEPAEVGQPTEEVVGAAVAMIVGAAELSLMRAREIAGNRLRNLAKKDAALAGKLQGVRITQVAATLGREGALALEAPPEAKLIEGTRTVFAEALNSFGIADGPCDAIGQMIEKYAARSLYDERASLPSQITNTIEAVVRESRGGKRP